MSIWCAYVCVAESYLYVLDSDYTDSLEVIKFSMLNGSI